LRLQQISKLLTVRGNSFEAPGQKDRTPQMNLKNTHNFQLSYVETPGLIIIEMFLLLGFTKE
jgi:hypothetical protein